MRKYALLAFIFLAVMSFSKGAEAAWIVGRSENFNIYGDGTGIELRAAYDQLNAHHQVLRAVFGTSPETKAAPLNVYLVAHVEKMRQVTPQSPPQRRGAYTIGESGTAFVAIRGGALGEQVLRHEYTHHFMMRFHPDFYPLWYAEGLADYLMTAVAVGEGVQLGISNTPRSRPLERDEFFPVARLLSLSVVPADVQQATSFYATGWLLVHYLQADEARRKALENYLQARGQGEPEAAAFQNAFGHDAAEMDLRLKSYFKQGVVPRTMNVKVRQAAADDFTVTMLPVSAENLLLPHLRISLGVPEADRAALLESLEVQVRKLSGDPYARKVYAAALVNLGNRQEGGRLAEELLEQSPADAELLYLRGLADYLDGRSDAARRREKYAAARPWFEKALRADPEHYSAAYRLSECEFVGGAAEQGLKNLLFAQSRAPSAGVIAVNAADILFKRGRAEEARRILLPISAYPDRPSGKRALEMLAGGR